MLIKAALNGARRPGTHPALPVTPTALAAASAAAVTAGAGAIHLHVRARQGEESLAPEDVAHTLAAVRAAVPRTPIGISTGAWIVRDPAARNALVAAWTVQPDFASVNFDEEGATGLAELLLSRRVLVEAGLRDAPTAGRWVESGLSRRCLRVLLEPQDRELPDALRTLAEIGAVLDAADVSCRRVVHGMGPTVWGMIEEAARRGDDTRVGLEDTLHLPDGSVAPDNAALVAAAWRRVSGPAQP